MSPAVTYKNKGWKGWGNFLGTKKIREISKDFMSMNDARGVIKKLNIKGRADWRKLCKSRKKPNGIPAGIESFYKDQGWKGWEDFLGTG